MNRVHQLLNISSGTLATLTGCRDYDALDAIHAALVHYGTQHPGTVQDTWMDVWEAFWPTYRDANGLTMLAQAIDHASRTTQVQLDREAIEAERATKLRPRKGQAPPCGLFEQTQQQLFGQ